MACLAAEGLAGAASAGAAVDGVVEVSTSLMQIALNVYSEQQELRPHAHAYALRILPILNHTIRPKTNKTSPVDVAVDKLVEASRDPVFMTTIFTVLATFAASVCCVVILLFLLKPKQPPAEEKKVEPPRAGSYTQPLILARLVTTVTSFSEGYDMACLGGMLDPLTQDLLLTQSQTAWCMGISPFMMAWGAPLGGWMADRFGRLPALTVAYIMMASGPILMVCANGFELLFFGRMLQSLGMGAGLVSTMTYVTEVSPAAVRGEFPGLTELFLTAGICTAFLVNFCLVDMGAWRWSFGVMSVFPTAMLPILLAGLPPESPRYLFMSGRRREAEEALRSLVDEEEAAEAIEQWDAACESAVESVSWADVLCPKTLADRRALLLCIVVLAANTSSGAGLLTAYAPVLLGVGMTDVTSNLAMMLISVGRLALLVPSILLMDIVGRRPFLLVSCIGVFVSTFLLCVFYFVGAPALPWLVVAVQMFYVGHAPGQGAVAYVYSAEVLDNRMRSKGVSVSIFVGRALGGSILLAFPAAVDHIGTSAVFLILSVFNACVLAFVALRAPETKRMRLEDIRRCFASGGK